MIVRIPSPIFCNLEILSSLTTISTSSKGHIQLSLKLCLIEQNFEHSEFCKFLVITHTSQFFPMVFNLNSNALHILSITFHLFLLAAPITTCSTCRGVCELSRQICQHRTDIACLFKYHEDKIIMICDLPSPISVENMNKALLENVAHQTRTSMFKGQIAEVRSGSTCGII